MADGGDLVLCADDFGLSADIDAGILALIERGRLSATGCMVAGPSFEADAPRLRRLADRVDVGLHLTLSDLPTLGDLSSLRRPASEPADLDTVLWRALTLRLDGHEVEAEIARQVHRFEAVMGRPPAFVDGHQHVHVFPVVRRALLDAFTNGLLWPEHTWLRDCRADPLTLLKTGVSVPKALFVSALSFGLGRAARRRGITTNRGFLGITAFAPQPSYGTLFAKFLAEVRPGTLVMCHPASPDLPAGPHDTIAAARRREYGYFASEDFARDLARAGLRIGRMRMPGAGVRPA